MKGPGILHLPGCSYYDRVKGYIPHRLVCGSYDGRCGILDECLRAGISVIVGGPYSSGILATGADPPDGRAPNYNYQPASDEVRARCRRIEAVCRKHRVPLIAAALQFPLTHPAVSCVIPGGKSAAEVRLHTIAQGLG